MKKLLTFLFLLICTFTNGKQISLDQAKLVATNFLTIQSSTKQNMSSKVKVFNQISLTQVTQLSKSNSTIFKSKSTVADSSLLYIFNVNDNRGFIVISGNDVTIPVLAYSQEGNLVAGNVPDGLMFFLNSYSEQLEYLKNNPITQPLPIKSNWTNLSNSVQKSPASVQEFIPLLDRKNIKWAQSGAFNYDFPMLNDSKKAITGCVATAISQVLRYYEQPKCGFGYYSYYHYPTGEINGYLNTVFGKTKYDWSLMPGDYTGLQDSDPSDLIKIKAVSSLMKQVGISVDMKYEIIEGKLISSTQTTKAVRALKENFGYSKNITNRDKEDEGISDSDWELMLINELNQNRPIIYTGQYDTIASHAFVCDGYEIKNNISYFNFNWGWGGESNNDKTYCTISNINPSGKPDNYKSYQSAIIGIEPIDYAYFNLELNKFSFQNFYYGSSASIDVNVTNKDNRDFYGTIYLAIFNNEDKHLLDIQEFENYTISGGETKAITFNYSNIMLLPNSYKLAVFYKTDGFNGIAIENGTSNNFADVNVISTFTKDIVMADAFSISKNPIIKNTPFSVTASFVNLGYLSYSGTVGLGIFDNSTLIKSIDEQQIQNVVQPFTKTITFLSDGINLNPGNYLLGVYRKTSEGDIVMIDPVEKSTKYLNVILPNDPYEPNDFVNNAFLLTSSENNSLNYNITTSNANISNSKDYDYYKIELPVGYNYKLKTTVYDSNNQVNTNDMTCDVVCRMYYNSKWHDQFNSTSPDITITNGGTIYFLIKPKDEFQAGSYILDIHIQKEIISTIPTVTTNIPSNITTATAICGGNITSDGGQAITARGVCWNSTGNPIIDDNKTNDGTGIGSFTSNLSGLLANTTYYARAYAINNVGAAYGNEVQFKTNEAYSWSTSSLINTVISSATGNQTSHQIIKDGKAGAIITWVDSRNGNNDIYAQSINSNGLVQWDTNGVSICNDSYNQNSPQIISDDNGGAIITWAESPHYSGRGSILAQRISSTGTMLWKLNGVIVSSAYYNSYSASSPRIVSDGNGGAIIAYAVPLNAGYAIYIQKINSNGVNQWGSNGVKINGNNYDLKIVSDGDGGAIVTWDDGSYYHKIYTQRINKDGVILWNLDGVSIGSGSTPNITSDGSSGAIITWVCPGTYSEIYVQRVSSNGIIQWPNYLYGGVQVSSGNGGAKSPQISTDSNGGAIITWEANFNQNYNIYAERVNSLGNAQWNPYYGIEVCASIGDQNSPQLEVDKCGRSIITWIDNKNGNKDIYAQRVNLNGTKQWSSSGVPICTNTNEQNSTMIVNDDNNGAIISWVDNRNSTSDIFCSKINSSGVLGGNNISLNDLPPDIAGSISGQGNVCQGQNNVTYTVPSISGATSYIWSLPSGATGSSSSNTINVNFSLNATSGKITVKGHNNCCDGKVSSLPIQINKTTTPVITLNNNILHSDAIYGNQWYNQNGLINGATDQDYIVTSNGDYYVINTLSGCSSEKSNTINILSTSINQIVLNNSINIYPNPVSNQFIIEINGNTDKKEIKISNSLGQIVYVGSVYEKEVVSIKDFPKGIYLIRIGNDKSFEIKKVLKN